MQALWHLYQVLQGWSDDVVGDGRRGAALARRALDLDPHHSLALAVDGAFCAHVDADLPRARRQSERAVAEDPQEPQAWLSLASIDSYEGLGDEAVVHAAQAIALSPLDPCRFVFNLMSAAGHLVAGRTDEAVALAEASARLNPHHAPTYRLQIIALQLGGQAQAASAVARQLLQIDPGFRVAQFVQRYPGRAHAHARSYIQALLDAGVPA